MAEHLVTLFHISDLHIGEMSWPSGDNPLSDEDIEWWKRFRPFNGYLGHTHVALQQVADLFRDVVEKDGEANVRVVVTGDLTTIGNGATFANAWAFLTSAQRVPGLHRGGNVAVIPGNHDHWPGRLCRWWRALTCMLGGPTRDFAQWFPARPMPPVSVPLRNNCVLRIDGLDSEEDVGSHSVERVCAIGDFVSQCQKLMQRLTPGPPGEIRVLLVHHSAIRDQVGGSSTMTAPSRDALANLVRSKRIAMVLTGHTHAHAFRTPANNDGIREARCGTSTSRDYFSRRHRVDPSFSSRLPRNVVLVHRLWGRHGRVEWHTEVWLRGRGSAGQFELHDTHDFGPVGP